MNWHNGRENAKVLTEGDENAQEVMSKLFSLLAEAEAAIRTGDEWLTPEEVDATIEV